MRLHVISSGWWEWRECGRLAYMRIVGHGARRMTALQESEGDNAYSCAVVEREGFQGRLHARQNVMQSQNRHLCRVSIPKFLVCHPYPLPLMAAASAPSQSVLQARFPHVGGSSHCMRYA